MPRTLPWLTGSVNKAQSAKSLPRRREVKQDEDSDPVADEKPKVSKGTSRSEKRDFLRSSPSPPTSPIQQCPSEEYLIEGFDHDDIYMMVEDEFYTMAQTFTQHLHYAEYVKRKKEAKLQNAAAVKDLARPTDGVTPKSEEMKRKEVAAALSARQKVGLEAIDAGRCRRHGDSDMEGNTEEEDDDDGLAGTSLGYLMTSPRRVRSLVGIQGIRSSTRAAAGYAQASGVGRYRADTDGVAPLPVQERDGRDDTAADETATEDDDLDVQMSKTPPRPRMPSTKSKSGSDISVSRTNSSTPDSTDMAVKKETQSVGVSYKAQPVPKSRKRVFFDDFDELPELSTESASTTDRFLSHTDTGNNTPKDQKGKAPDFKKSRLNEVPTFLL